MNEKLRVFSGQCCLCDVGRPTGKKDISGIELFTGDIVQLWHGNYIGTDAEEWLPSTGLTVVVANQYQSYSDGKIVLVNSDAKAFTMGIANIGICGGEWKAKLVKSHRDIVAGERLVDFGFNFRAKEVEK